MQDSSFSIKVRFEIHAKSPKIRALKEQTVVKSLTQIQIDLLPLLQSIIDVVSETDENLLAFMMLPARNLFTSSIPPSYALLNAYLENFLTLLTAIKEERRTKFSCPVLRPNLLHTIEKARSSHLEDQTESLFSLLSCVQAIYVEYASLDIESIKSRLEKDEISTETALTLLGTSETRAFSKEKVLSMCRSISSDYYFYETTIQQTFNVYAHVIIFSHNLHNHSFSSQDLLDFMGFVSLWSTLCFETAIPEHFSQGAQALLEKMRSVQRERETIEVFCNEFITASTNVLKMISETKSMSYLAFLTLFRKFLVIDCVRKWYLKYLPLLEEWKIEITKMKKKNPREASALIDWIEETNWLEIFTLAEKIFDHAHFLLHGEHLNEDAVEYFIRALRPAKKLPCFSPEPYIEEPVTPSPTPISPSFSEGESIASPTTFIAEEAVSIEEEAMEEEAVWRAIEEARRRSLLKREQRRTKEAVEESKGDALSVPCEDIVQTEKLLDMNQRKGRSIEQFLQQYGAKFLRQRGSSHRIYKIDGASIPIPRHGELKKGTLAAINRQIAARRR